MPDVCRVDDVVLQYGAPDSLQVRIDTYRRYQEREIDLDFEAERLLGLGGGESILDVGCGPGRFLDHIRRAGHVGRLVGLDQSPGMIDQVRGSSSAAQGVVGDATSLPFGADTLDIVVARHMLYHVENISEALGELKRVAAGRILISTGSSSSTLYLDALLARVVGDLGYSPATRVMSRFCTENAGEWLTAAGYAWREVLIDNALVFYKADPIVRYILSCLPTFGIMPGDERYSSTGRLVEEIVRLDLEREGGVIKDPTRVGFYVVDLQRLDGH